MIFFVCHHPLKSQYHWTLLIPRSLIHLFSKCFGCLMQVSAQWDVCNWRHMREEIVVGGLKSEKFTPHCVQVSRRMHKGDIYWHSCCFWKEICWLHFYSLLTDYFYLSKITPIQQLSSFSCCRISSTSKISILLKTFHSSRNPILDWIPNRISLFTYQEDENAYERKCFKINCCGALCSYFCTTWICGWNLRVLISSLAIFLYRVSGLLFTFFKRL